MVNLHFQNQHRISFDRYQYLYIYQVKINSDLRRVPVPHRIINDIIEKSINGRRIGHIVESGRGLL